MNSIAYLISNSKDSGNGLSWSGVESFRSRDFDLPRVGLLGDSFSMASDDKSKKNNLFKFKKNYGSPLKMHVNSQVLIAKVIKGAFS